MATEQYVLHPAIRWMLAGESYVDGFCNRCCHLRDALGIDSRPIERLFLLGGETEGKVCPTRFARDDDRKGKWKPDANT